MALSDLNYLPPATRRVFEKLAEQSLSPITYSETLIYTDDLPEENMNFHLDPAEKIDKNQLSLFFVTELKKIKDQLE